MKTVNSAQSHNVANKPKWSPMTTLYSIKDGTPKVFHNIDAKEKLKVHPDRWSLNPVSVEQAQAEDAEIIEEKKPEVEQVKAEVEKPKATPAIETVRQRKARLKAEAESAKAHIDKSDDK